MGGTMKYIKYFETIDGVIISHTYKDFENPIAIGDTQ